MIHILEQMSSMSAITKGGVTLVAVVTVTLVARCWRSRSSSSRRFLIQNPPKDVVILHQYGKALTVPSVSPFVMKLETYLRVTKIPYINKFSRQPGPKGKLPWIQYNDQAMPDSQLCIQFLNAERNVDLNKHLTPDQVAIGHLVRKTAEESLYWVLLMWRLSLETSGVLYKKLGLPSLIIWYMRRASKPKLWSHGIGRYTQEEVIQIMEDDLRAISQIIGDKKFLFDGGADDVTEFDCALFGQLCQLVWQMPGSPVGDIIAEKYPNLVGFCERMKTAYWPDWEKRLLQASNAETPDTAEESVLNRTSQAIPLGAASSSGPARGSSQTVRTRHKSVYEKN